MQARSDPMSLNLHRRPTGEVAAGPTVEATVQPARRSAQAATLVLSVLLGASVAVAAEGGGRTSGGEGAESTQRADQGGRSRAAGSGRPGGSGAPAQPDGPPAQRADPRDSRTAWRWQTVARGLHHPWGLAFLPDGRFLVTERRGTLRIIGRDGTVEPPIGGVPAVHAKGQGGLLDVAVPADFEETRQVYVCFSEATPGGFSSTALAVGELSANERRLNRVRVLFSQRPRVASQLHFGCRIVFDGDRIFLTLGERYHEMKQAQSLDNHLGKVVRINRDGSVPADNPFVKTKGALPEIWSYGHRNPQGATLGPDGQLWLHEHGPQGGDEINRVQAGANYGWPVISYGEQYGGGPIGSGRPAAPGMAQPLYYWRPSIAPSGMSFVRGDRYGRDWRGNLLVGALKFMYLARLRLGDDGRVLSEERIPVDERVRDVREAADGHIYILTDSDDGQLLRLQAP